MKKKMVFRGVAILLCAVILMLTGCSNAAQCKTSVDLMFGVYRRGDAQAVEGMVRDFAGDIKIPAIPDTISSMFSGIFPATELNFQISGKIIASMIQKTMENLKWSNKSTRTVSDREIVVTTEVSNLDMKAIVGKYALKVAEFTLTSLFSGYSEDEKIQKCRIILDDVVKENRGNRMTWTVDIVCRQVNGQWQVVMSDEIINAMTGGLLSMYSSVTYILSQFSQYFK